LAENGVLAYMAYVDEKLVEEEERAKKYLDGETDGKSKGKVWIFNLKLNLTLGNLIWV